jgi:hypothetical protein
MPWEIDTDGVCVTDATYTGEVCTVTQYYSWEHAFCVDLDAHCYPWESADLTGECITDTAYTGEVCDLD